MHGDWIGFTTFHDGVGVIVSVRSYKRGWMVGVYWVMGSIELN
jgi:hypothetical protein